MTNVLVELLVPKETCEAISQRFVAVNGRFEWAAHNSGQQYESVTLVVVPFGACNRSAVIKIMDPFVRSDTPALEKELLHAWQETQTIIGDLVKPDAREPLITYPDGFVN